MTKTYTADEVRAMLRRQCEEAGGQKAWATENRVSTAYVNDILQCRKMPGGMVAEILGVHRSTVYRWIRDGGLKAERHGRDFFTTMKTK